MRWALKRELRPFFWASFLWLLLGLVLAAGVFSSGNFFKEMVWFVVFWSLGVGDLATIAALVFAITSWGESSDRVKMGLRITILTGLKVTLLLIFGAILFLKHGIPQSSLLVGLGTLIVVPLLGGLFWTFQVQPEQKA
ncbi:MAG: hypothetical protein RJB38_1973 [Pseudomonadota bacterium]|jgi:hypothetical protein